MLSSVESVEMRTPLLHVPAQPDSEQDEGGADDRDHDHEFDEGEALLGLPNELAHYFSILFKSMVSRVIESLHNAGVGCGLPEFPSRRGLAPPTTE